ncbi:MAG: prepilin peptidase [Alphaproteobacteria bacterium]|nr:prepilin peptidase [Alphaproteobacteria bacterium]
MEVIIGEIFLIACLGLILGSFTTAIVYRVPRDISWGMKRSSCPSCNSVLGTADLVPFFSWCLNKGKCRHCKATIPLFYPLVELTCMGLCLVAYSVYDLSIPGIFVYAAMPFLLALFLIDFKHMILPNQLILVLFFLGILRLLYFWGADGFFYETGMDILINYVLASFVFALLSWGIGALTSKLLKKESLGFGDVKFFGLAGLWLGLEALPLFMIYSGGLAIILALVWRYIKDSDVFPFGPALIVVFIIMLFSQGVVVI